MNRAAPRQQAQKLAYTVEEAIEVSGIGRSALYEEMAAGRLIARKRGRTTLILFEELNEYLRGLPIVDRGEDADSSE